MSDRDAIAANPTTPVRLIGIGFGPMHLALAAALDDVGLAGQARFHEARDRFAWHPGLQVAGADMQTPFLKDLVTPANPCSRHSFLCYLLERGRLERFIDNRILYPSRIEFEDYLRWAAERLAPAIRYGSRVRSVDLEASGDGFIVTREDGQRERARHVSIAVGLSARLPPLRAIDRSRIVHATDYVPAITRLIDLTLDARRSRHADILVVGAGQSSAEIVLDLRERLPMASVTVAARGFVFRTVEANAWANGLYGQTCHDRFRTLPAERRAALLNDMRLANYGAVDADLLATLARRDYEDEVRGRPRLIRRGYTEVVDVEDAGPRYRVSLADVIDGTRAVAEFDIVIFATGFDTAGMLRVIEPLHERLRRDGSGKFLLRPDYSAVMADQTGEDKHDGHGPRLFLHGYGNYFTDTTIICNLARRAAIVMGAIEC